MRAALFAVMCLLLAGCQAPGTPGQMPEPTPTEDEADGCSHWLGGNAPQPRVTFVTSKGTIVAEICRDAVPVTGQNFIDLVSSGFYDGTSFHRVITDFMMQGGDPNSKDDNPGNDGQGGPGYAIPDEFHRLLRHDTSGILSMANSGPNSGGSQFFITFEPTPWLDDKHSVFGKVVRGMNVLRAVESVGSTSGSTSEDVVLESAKVSIPGERPKITDGVALWVPVDTLGVQMVDQTLHGIVVVENLSPSKQHVVLTTEVIPEAMATIEEAYQAFDIPARQRVVVLVEIDMPARAGGRVIEIVATAEGGTATANITVNRDGSVGPDLVEDGDSVRANYVGLTVDGRVFDTSRKDVGDYVVANNLGYGFPGRDAYNPFTFTVGGGVIQGFTDLAMGTPEGGQDAARIAPEKAYGASGSAPLAGRTLIFHLDVLAINPE